jgi:predicted regulator of Ras-like GTPase activity (Roadblock/LC7/MglB family)
MTGHLPLRDKIQGFIDEIMELNGVITSALVSKDGLVMGKSCDTLISVPTFSAMSATMLASAEAAASILHLQPPAIIEVETGEETIFIRDAGERALITVVANSSADKKSVKTQLDDIARRIGEEI